MEWQREGLGVPPAVEKATDGYREEMDPLRDFIADYCVLGERLWAPAGQLREAYERWAREAGETVLLKGRKWGERLRSHGCNPDTGTGGLRIWRGIALANGPDEGPEGGGSRSAGAEVADSATVKNTSKTEESDGGVAESGAGIGKAASESPREANLPKVPQQSATPQPGGPGKAPRRLTEEDERVKRLISEGMKSEIARGVVLEAGVGDGPRTPTLPPAEPARHDAVSGGGR